MRALEEMIFMALGAIIFCLSVVFLLSNVSKLKKANEALDERGSRNDIVYESYLESSPATVTYAELMATFMGDSLEYDTFVDYVEIKAAGFSPLRIAEYTIPKYANYSRKIVFNTDGTIKYIQYWGI